MLFASTFKKWNKTRNIWKLFKKPPNLPVTLPWILYYGTNVTELDLLPNCIDNSNSTKSSKICTDSHFSTVIPQAELVPEKPKRSALNQLTRLLLRKYNCGVRPVQNWTKPTTVYIDLIIQSILDVVSAFQPLDKLLVLLVILVIQWNCFMPSFFTCNAC